MENKNFSLIKFVWWRGGDIDDPPLNLAPSGFLSDFQLFVFYNKQAT